MVEAIITLIIFVILIIFGMFGTYFYFKYGYSLYLKSECKSLTNNNMRLHREVRELKKLNKQLMKRLIALEAEDGKKRDIISENKNI